MTIKECLKSKMFREYLAGAQKEGSWAPTLFILRKDEKPLVTALTEAAGEKLLDCAEYALRNGADAVIVVAESWVSATSAKTGIRASKSADRESAISVSAWKLSGDKMVDAGFSRLYPMAAGASIGK